MYNQGRVIKTDGSFASVEIIKSGACSHDCQTCSGCTFDNKSHILALNQVNAKPGDFVEIKGDGRILYRAFLIYLLPIILFFAGYILGASLKLQEAFSLSIGLLLFVLCMVINIYISRAQKKKGKLPKIIKIL